MWSLSADKLFGRCQRQWFYKSHYAQWNSKKVPLRRRAFVLSKLQSISAVRGSVVDEILEKHLVPALNRGRIPEKNHIKDSCLQLFDARMSFAREHRLSEYAETVVKLPDEFTILQACEYGDGIEESEATRARDEIEIAIDNLYEMDSLLDTLLSSRYAIAQRSLVWHCAGHAVKAFPDLVAFFDDEAPIVLDWKVHFFGNADASRQLASYALALCKVQAEKPHSDFPESLGHIPPEEIRLWEVQLLVPDLRVHTFEENQYVELEEFIASRAETMALAVDGRKKPSEFQPTDFSTAFEARQCQQCNFKQLCWE